MSYTTYINTKQIERYKGELQRVEAEMRKLQAQRDGLLLVISGMQRMDEAAKVTPAEKPIPPLIVRQETVAELSVRLLQETERELRPYEFVELAEQRGRRIPYLTLYQTLKRHARMENGAIYYEDGMFGLREWKKTEEEV